MCVNGPLVSFILHHYKPAEIETTVSFSMSRTWSRYLPNILLFSITGNMFWPCKRMSTISINETERSCASSIVYFRS